MNHFKQIRNCMEEKGLDALIITSEANRFYASAFHTTGADDALVIITKKKNYLITDSRYTEAAQAQLKDVTLKLGKNDFSMGVGYEYTIPLACDLDYDEIEWSTGNPHVATIENGVITTHGRGTTQMFARYGDQEVTGWIRVK